MLGMNSKMLWLRLWTLPWSSEVCVSVLRCCCWWWQKQQECLKMFQSCLWGPSCDRLQDRLWAVQGPGGSGCCCLLIVVVCMAWGFCTDWVTFGLITSTLEPENPSWLILSVLVISCDLGRVT